MIMRAMGGTQVQRTSFLFIDGAYLDEIAADVFTKVWNTTEVPLDYGRLSQAYTKTYYYHCPPPQKRDEDDASWQARCLPYFERAAQLGELRGWHVFEGTTKRHKKRGPTQKEVDVQLAVDLLTHSFKRNMDTATLLAGDQDFRPVVEAASREGMFITLQSMRQHANPALRMAADAREELTPSLLLSWVHASYRKPYEPPSYGHASAEFMSRARLAAGTDASGIPYHMYRDAEYMVFSPLPHGPSPFQMWMHKDPDILRNFIAAFQGPIDWT